MPALILAAGIAFGQSTELDNALKLLEEDQFDSSLVFFNKVDLNQFQENQKARFYESRAEAYLALDKQELSFEDYLEAKSIWERLDSLKQKANINLQIVNVLSHQPNTKALSRPYLNEFVEYAKESGNPIDLANAYDRIARTYLYVDDFDEALKYFNLGVQQAYLAEDTLKAVSIKFNAGSAFNADNAKQYNLALKLFKEIMPYFEKIDNPDYIAYNYNNQGKAYFGLKQYEKAIELFEKADSIPLTQNVEKTKRIIYSNLGQLYRKTGDFQKALLFMEKETEITEDTDERYQDLRIDLADTKMQRLLEERRSSRNKNIAFGLAGTLLLGSIIAFLVYRNTKRKQRIAEQEKEIEIQKTEKLLKDQELNTIDAMIAGQEKERQRLASDLHDSVGATLSAAKMQFDHLKKNRGSLKNEDEIYERTKDLLEEAYTEVRSMAHAKNSGVIAKNGLLPAVNKLAKNASSTGKLKIEVQDYGLDQRLEGPVEIAVFRMIQELVTNIIKHADATEASISLTQHEDSLNIVVEDNGKGFKTGSLSKGDGMGLGSIEKRVEHMEGHMEVDSTPGKGTSIIIDIPL